MAKKSAITLEDLAGMVQRGFETERTERAKESQMIHKEMADGFKAVHKEMADGFKKNDREHETMMDDILWLKRELADIRHKIHGLPSKKDRDALHTRVDRIEAHLGFATTV